MRFTSCIFMIFVSSVLAGCCGTTPLESWTKDRGYVFDPNYSDLQLLGSTIVGSRSVPDPQVDVKGARGNVTNFNVTTDSNFSVDGSVTSQKALTAISNANISGSFAQVDHTEFSVKSPYRMVANTFVPLNPCSSGQFEMAYDVLNTGELSITFKDSTNATLDAKAVINNVTDPQLNLKYDATTKGVETGSGMFVGYVPYRVECTEKHSTVTLTIGGGYDPNAFKNDAVFLDANGTHTNANGKLETVLIFQNAPVPAVRTVSDLGAPQAAPDPHAVGTARTLSLALKNQMLVSGLAGAPAFQRLNLRTNARDALNSLLAQATQDDPFSSGTRADSNNDTFTDTGANSRIVEAGDTLRLGGGDGQPLHIITITQLTSTSVTAEVYTIVYKRLDPVN